MPKIYTKAGDTGKSFMPSAGKRDKHDIHFQTVGDIDELCAYLGVLMSSFYNLDAHSELIQIQKDLFEIGADIATPIKSDSFHSEFYKSRIEELEKSIDSMEDENVPLEAFILPNGSTCVPQFHYARAICRRAERSLVHLSSVSFTVWEAKTHAEKYFRLTSYLNRLSDWLFVAARYYNNDKEIEWHRSAT